MPNRDVLINLLLNHWQQHLPKMYQQFLREDRLQKELERAAEATSDRLHELIVIQKLSDNRAWEIVRAEMFQGEPKEEQPQTI